MSSDAPEKKGRGPGRPFTGGSDPRRNAAGRMKGLEQRTREIVGDDINGITYVQRCVALGCAPDADRLVAMGIDLTPAQREQIGRTFAEIKVKDVNEAAEKLKDRGWHKVRQAVEVTVDTPAQRIDVSALSDAQLEALAALPLIEVADDSATEH